MIVTTNDDLYRGMVFEDFTAEAKEVSRYKDALFAGYRRMLDKGLIAPSDIEAINEPVNQKKPGIRTNLMNFDDLTRIANENGEIFQHFGHTEQFKLYDVEDGRIVSEQIVPTNGSGHGALAGFLKAAQADALICGGIGMGAQTALAEAGIKLYGGVTGSADAAAQALVEGKLAYDPNAKCDHHGHHHGEEHECGHHHGEGHECGHHHGKGLDCGHQEGDEDCRKHHET